MCLEGETTDEQRAYGKDMHVTFLWTFFARLLPSFHSIPLSRLLVPSSASSLGLIQGTFAESSAYIRDCASETLSSEVQINTGLILSSRKTTRFRS